MTISVSLTPETEQLLITRAEREGANVEELASALLAETLAYDARDFAEAVAGIREGLADAEAGRERPLAVFIREQREKHSFGDEWPKA